MPVVIEVSAEGTISIACFTDERMTCLSVGASSCNYIVISTKSISHNYHITWIVLFIQPDNTQFILKCSMINGGE